MTGWTRLAPVEGGYSKTRTAAWLKSSWVTLHFTGCLAQSWASNVVCAPSVGSPPMSINRGTGYAHPHVLQAQPLKVFSRFQTSLLAFFMSKVYVRSAHPQRANIPNGIKRIVAPQEARFAPPSAM
jgi:hypothetical protein